MSIGIIQTLFYEKARPLGTSKNRLCLILGAGADISSGGKTFSDLKKSCVEEFSGAALPSFLLPQSVDDYFNDFFGNLVSEDVRASVVDYLFHGLESLKPSDGYKLLVLLAKAGIIDAIITTNFDNLLEEAQRELGLDIFQIYAAGVASPYVLGNQLFSPPRPVYIKLHGDIKAKRITHLTASEIKGKAYDRAFSMLLQSILRTHTLIFIGYSGGDQVFADELRKASAKIARPIYWCNITPLSEDSPCAAIFNKEAITSVETTFEQLLCEAGAYPLRNSEVLKSEPHFLLPLIKERIKCANEQFLNSYAYKNDSIRLGLLQARKSTLDQIASFRFNSDKPLAVLTGFSGVGKTTLLCQLQDAEDPSPLPRLLLLSAQPFASTDFAKELVVRLGYSSNNPLALIYELSAWLRKSGQQLLVAIDGLNEFDWSFRRCLDLFKEILRVALWVEAHGSLKLIVTMRPETWDELYSTLDHGDLRKVLWNESEFKDDLRSLHLARFSPQELAGAYDSYARHFGVTTPLRQLPDETKKQLADPYFLALTMKQGRVVDPTRVASQLYGHAFVEILARSFERGKAMSVENSLLRLASIGLSKHITHFRLEELESIGLGHEELRALREIPILQMSDNGTYSFAHDRAHEYYLARAISSELTLVQVRDWGELTKAIELGRSYPRLASALLQCIVNSPRPKREHYLHLILDGFKARSTSSSNHALAAEENVLDFCKEVFFTLAAEQPKSFKEIVDSYLNRQDLREDKDLLARLLIRASVLLPLHLSLPLFLRARKVLGAEAQGEADVFLADKVAEYLLEQPFTEYKNCFNGGPIYDYVFEPGLEKWENALRLLRIITRLGHDNTHPDEWQHLSTCVSDQLDQIFAGYSFAKSSGAALAEMVDRHSSTVLFNAGPGVIEKFATSEKRFGLKQIFDEIDSGRPLTLEQVISLRPYVEELDQNIEFVIANFFFVISMKLDQDHTIQLFADYFETFGEHTRTEELDFFLSAVSLSHLALGYPCQALVAHYTEKMLLVLPQISLGYPGAVRGERRALFTDPFEQQFEDGFNPLAFYFYNAPSELRRSLHYKDYVRFAHEAQDTVALYWKFLEQYEEQQNQTGIIRIVHALGQMINLWPIEGLVAVEKLVGRTEQTIRRAIVRVLTEANARFPMDTSAMLSRAGSGFTEGEQRQIHWAGDSHMAYRSLEQVHWARVMRFLDQRDSSGRAFNKITQALVDSKTLPEALGLIMNDVLICRPI
jgi:hypothetical protein